MPQAVVRNYGYDIFMLPVAEFESRHAKNIEEQPIHHKRKGHLLQRSLQL